MNLPAPASAPSPTSPTPAAAEPAVPEDDPLRYAHAGFRLEATLHEIEQPELGQSRWELDLEVARPTGRAVELELDQRVRTGCQTASVVVEGLPSLGDPRLAMLNLRCDTGEDYLSRSVVTALLFVAEPPSILWEGSGTYASQMGQCEYIDVPVFERGPSGKVRALQWFEVLHHPPENPSTTAIPCKPAARRTRQVAEIEIPR